MCIDYTEDTLSDKSNNVETCNPGCGEGTKYKCKKGYVYDSKSKSCKAKNPNDGKIYYVTVDANITPQFNKDSKSSGAAVHYAYGFTFSGKFTLPDVSNDTFFTENEIGFAAKLQATANVSCSSTEEHDLRVYTQPAYPKMGKEQTVSAYDLDNAKGTTDNTFTSTNANCTMQKYELDKTNSKYWVGFATGQALSTDDNLFTNCKTISKNGSSRTICIKYTDVQDITCERWVAENFPDFSIVKSGHYLNVTGKTLLLNDLNMTTSANVNGGTLVGPKYFNYDKCQALDTPTISVTSKLTPAVTLTDGTISDLNIHFDQVVYKYDGYITEACSFYEDCISGNYTYHFYDYVRSNGFNCPDSFSAEVESDDELLCRAYNLIKSDYNNCYDPYNTLLYNDHQLKECSDSYGHDCSCTEANSTVCKAMNYAHNYCANNTYSAVEGYGKMHNISISTKPDTNVAGLINNKGGVLTLSGNNNFVASADYDKNSFGVFARNVIIADGTTRVYSGRGFSIYNYDSKAELTINKDATLIIEYAHFNGLDMTWGGTANIYGKLKVSSWGSGGKFHNDIATNKGTINAKSTSCIIIPNGASGTGGYTGTVNSGTLNFATGSQLKIKGICKKATTSGSAVIKDQDKPNNLYGDFTSHPSGFTASCDASCN